MIGFTNYDVVETPTTPTTAEMVAALSASQRAAILQGFADKVLPQRLKTQIFITTSVIRHLYERIDAIENYCVTLCRGMLVDTPAEYDEEGNLVTAAEYVVAPTSLNDLKAAVDSEFGDEFTSAQSAAIVDKMIAMSKSDGSGNVTYWIQAINN